MQGPTVAFKLGGLMDVVESAHREVRKEHRRGFSEVLPSGAIDPVEKGAVSPCREPVLDLLPRCSETVVAGR